ncbi:MAG: aminotransferase class IV [Actinomycetota bacterium]|nr:aminotransferase class IV [Actinomycetota bacterium]
MSVTAWVNGRLVDPGEAALSAVDHGVTVGDGVFETTKLVDGRPFALTRHLERLDRSVAGLGLPPVDRDLLCAGITAVLGARDPIAFGRLRFTVTGGVGPLGSDRDDAGLTYIVATVEQEQPTGSGKVSVVPWTRNERSATAGLKTTSYADNVIALARAKQSGAMEAILANTRGELCEGTGSNVFVVLDSDAGVVVTPPLQSGPLAGVTRGLVLQWGREAGLDLREESLALDVLQTADEVFLTSSIKDIFPVHAVDHRSLPAPGPVTARLVEIFATRSALEVDP